MSANISLKRGLERSSAEFHPEKKSRIVTPASENKVAAVSHYTDLEKDTAQHGYVRIQLLYLAMLVFQEIARRTDGSVADIKVKMLRARRQVGQGNKENHAAHPNGFACFDDTMRDDIVDGVHKNQLTPKKLKILKAKGLTSEDIDYLKTNYENIDLVKKCIFKHWKHPSLLEGSLLELILNLTHVLPRRINLACDLPLEKTFKYAFMEKLFLDVMKGNKTPESAISECALKFQSYFTKKIQEIREELDATKDLKRKNLLQSDLFSHECELKGSVITDLDRIKSDLGDDPLRLLQPLL